MEFKQKPRRNPSFELPADVVKDYRSKDYSTSISLNARRGLARIVAGIVAKTEPVGSGVAISITKDEAEFLRDVFFGSRKLDLLEEKAYKGRDKEEDPLKEAITSSDADEIIKTMKNKERNNEANSD